MNATNSYLETCRYLLEVDVDDPVNWVEIHRLLSGVRLGLTCCVCGRLLRGPMGQSPSVCLHHVCRDCVGGKMRYIKRGCGWCKSFDEFVANGQLECIVRCFRQLCQYLRRKAGSILSSLSFDDAVSGALKIIEEATKVDSDMEGRVGEMGSSSKQPEGSQKKGALLQPKSESFRSRKRKKASKTSDDNESDKEICFNYKKARHDPLSSVKPGSDRHLDGETFNSFAGDERCRSVGTGRYGEKKPCGNGRLTAAADSSHDGQFESNGFDSGCDSEKKLENSILAEHDYNKFISDEAETNVGNSNWTTEEQPILKRPSYSRDQAEIGRRTKVMTHELVADASVSSTVVSSTVVCGGGSSNNGDNSTGDSLAQRYKGKGKTGCRCALATPNPGKLTCCGQRCPCYAAFRGCDNCKCRGCRNPRGDPKNIPASMLHSVTTAQTSTLNKISATVS